MKDLQYFMPDSPPLLIYCPVRLSSGYSTPPYGFDEEDYLTGDPVPSGRIHPTRWSSRP